MAWPRLEVDDDEGVEIFVPDPENLSRFKSVGKSHPGFGRCEWCGCSSSKEICLQCGGPRQRKSVLTRGKV